jgi:hypothetical protein
MLAPIVLFVYNRPWHTEQTLQALALNSEAAESVLYIYADGPKENATIEDLKRIKETRTIIAEKQWCKKVEIIESAFNKGLADSIINGVTMVVNKYGKVIVLEDDIVVSRGFLQFMNDSLEIYENEQQVMHISGYMFPVKERLPQTFFYRQTSCWGWGTWANKWQYFERSPAELYRLLHESGIISMVDIDGTNQFLQQLQKNIDGILKSWGVLWHFSVFLKGGLCLHPGRSLVKNVGMDSSGVNCDNTTFFDGNIAENIPVKKIPIRDFSKVYKYLRNFYGTNVQPNFFLALRQRLIGSIPAKFRQKIKNLID